MPPLFPVILAGGSGTRLWPVSREALPKQLVRLDGESLLQRTARRLLPLAASAGEVVTVGARAQGFLVRDQLAAVAPALTERLVLEPMGRDTAAAVALAALHVRDAAGCPDALLWVCPSDHLVGDEAALIEAVRRALPAAAAGELVTFGIAPTRAETGYGYIQIGQPLPGGLAGVFRALRFVEKPDRARAEAMLAAGGHHWNSGIFLFGADRVLEELGAFEPGLLAAVEAAYAAAERGADGALHVPAEPYAQVPSLPIDKAVMERSERVAVVPCDPGWSDLGSWQAVWEQRPRDLAGNAVRGEAVVLDDCRDCLIHAEGRLVACAGLRDLAVVETADAVLVADRRDAEAVRRIVAALKATGRPEAEAFRDEVRPWGSFKVLHEGPGFKVKELAVRPGGRLSLQSHRHRAEHWTVVEGTARVQVDDEVRDLGPNEHVQIPLGAKHRLENPGTGPMRLIEVQCGDYLGEDDIVRYEDVYGRS